MGRKLTYDIIKKEFEEQDYILVSNEYINSRQELEYICKKHKHRGIQKIKYANFQSGSRCAFCQIEEGHPPNHLPEIIYKEETENMGYIYKGINYIKGKAVIDFVCKNHLEKGIQQANWTSIRSGKCSCGICNGINKTTEEFKKEIYEILPDIDVVGEYIGARKRIKCKCKICKHEWNPLSYNLKSGFGCPICADKLTGLKRRTSVEFKMDKLIKMHPEIEFLTCPKLSTDYVECRCKKCNHEWRATYVNMTKTTKTTGCPMCAGSNSEIKLINIIKNIGLKYETQKTFDDCRYIHKLPFDVYLIDYNVLIEFDGEGHYKPIPRGNMTQEDAENELKLIKIRDNIKTDYCIKNQISLIRIPYWERDDMEYFLLDKLIKLNILEEVKIA